MAGKGRLMQSPHFAHSKKTSTQMSDIWEAILITITALAALVFVCYGAYCIGEVVFPDDEP